jgi:hypothetical protein
MIRVHLNNLLTKNPFIEVASFYLAMIKTTFILTFGLLVTMAAAGFISSSIDSGIFNSALAQPIIGSSQGLNMTSNQTGSRPTMAATSDTQMTDLTSYNNPNLGFTLQYPSNWQKQESLNFVSPQGGAGNRAPELIDIITEVLPTSDYTLDSYTEAVLGQIELLPDFILMNTSSTTLGGIPAHMAVYSFTDETQLENLRTQIWTVNDGMAYIISYSATPDEFESSLPALQSVIDSFSIDNARSGEVGTAAAGAISSRSNNSGSENMTSP